jgi:hypothetical protein
MVGALRANRRSQGDAAEPEGDTAEKPTRIVFHGKPITG